MSNRYDNRLIFRNRSKFYEKLFEERGVKSIRHFNTAVFGYPSPGAIRGLTTVPHMWTAGDRFYKLAAYYYSMPQYWWVIALYNKLPTEANVSLGELIYIPLPIEKILSNLV